MRRLGHDRWKLENNGWNDLTQNWAFKHGFLHACQHRSQTVSAEGERKLYPMISTTSSTDRPIVRSFCHPQD